MDKEPMVTVPVVDATKTEEMLPQSQVNGLIAKEVKAATEKLLKDMGVEDFKSAKEGIAKAKEIAEAQKTEAQKLSERNAELEATLTQAQLRERTRDIEDTTKNILRELEIDDKYLKTILKLTDLTTIEDINEDNLKEVIEKTINEELPMLVKGEKIKIGAIPTVGDKIPAGTNAYLAEKYKGNKYYKG